jgi:hypothetical protein
VSEQGLKTKFVLAVIGVAVIVVMGILLWAYWGNVDYSNKTKHETDSWGVIKDSKGDIMAIETTNPIIWNTLVNLKNNQTEMWIGGIVEEYGNYWGFRFRPATIVVAEITIEGAQSNIQGISEDLNYWINVWGKEAYVLSRVIETNP